jgi:Na+-driven multidrug efflux pump
LYWYATGGESLVNKVLVVTVLVQVGLSLWLIPMQGVIGAAMAVAVAEATGVLLLFIPIVQAKHRDEQ